LDLPEVVELQPFGNDTFPGLFQVLRPNSDLNVFSRAEFSKQVTLRRKEHYVI